MKISKASTGTAIFLKQPAIEYHRQGYLDKFYTTFIEHPNYWLSRVISKSVGAEIQRRAFHDLPLSAFELYPWKEIARTIASKKFSPGMADQIWEWADLSFDRWVASKLSSDLTAIEVVEHSSLQTILTAKKKGIVSVYEQPSQHHSFLYPIVQQLLKEKPELVTPTTKLQINEKSVRRNERRDKELAAADIIMCNSSFTKRTLLNSGLVKENKILVNPYGFPAPVPKQEYGNTKKLVFLNAGTQNLRKGLHLLYDVWKQPFFQKAEMELWLIGAMNLPPSLLQGIGANVKIMSSIPREELMRLYQQVDVFVLPTYADGFGMVISEAMSRGIPVITTYNSGGPDIIEHGKNGFLIPAGDEGALLEQMKWCVENRHLLAQIGQNALATAKKWQWEDSRKNHVDLVTNKIATIKEAWKKDV